MKCGSWAPFENPSRNDDSNPRRGNKALPEGQKRKMWVRFFRKAEHFNQCLQLVGAGGSQLFAGSGLPPVGSGLFFPLAAAAVGWTQKRSVAFM